MPVPSFVKIHRRALKQFNTITTVDIQLLVYWIQQILLLVSLQRALLLLVAIWFAHLRDLTQMPIQIILI